MRRAEQEALEAEAAAVLARMESAPEETEELDFEPQAESVPGTVATRDAPASATVAAASVGDAARRMATGSVESTTREMLRALPEDSDQMRQDPDEAALEQMKVSRDRVESKKKELLIQESRLRREHEEAFRLALAEGRRPPAMRSALRNQARDASLPRHSDGTIVDSTGGVLRWVRGTDTEGRASPQRVSEIRDWGGQIVKDKLTGEAIVWGSMVLMFVPEDGEAGRKAFHEADRTRMDEEKEREWIHAVEDANRAYGRDAFRPIKGKDHGREIRREMPLDREEYREAALTVSEMG